MNQQKIDIMIEELVGEIYAKGDCDYTEIQDELKEAITLTLSHPDILWKEDVEKAIDEVDNECTYDKGDGIISAERLKQKLLK